MSKHDEIIYDLEKLVDAEGLSGIVGDLAEICHLKAQHLFENWQDRNSASVWSRMASILYKTEARMEV